MDVCITSAVMMQERDENVSTLGQSAQFSPTTREFDQSMWSAGEAHSKQSGSKETHESTRVIPCFGAEFCCVHRRDVGRGAGTGRSCVIDAVRLFPSTSLLLPPVVLRQGNMACSIVVVEIYRHIAGLIPAFAGGARFIVSDIF